MKCKLLNATLAGLLLSATCLANLANAGLIVGSTMDTSIDTISGYEWLDFSFTVGMTYDEVLASSYVVSDGYEIATSEQIKALWVSAGRFTDVTVAANAVLDKLGCMSYLHGGYNCDQVGQEWTGAFYQSATAQYDIYLVNTLEGISGSFLEYWVGNIDKNSSFRADIAAYLVRTPDVPSEVPEPSTLAIFALGLMGLAVRRFKKQ